MSATKGDFRKILIEEFVRRSKKNKRYSIRAYARALQIHHGTLSQILRGKRKLTQSTVSFLGEKLGLPFPEISKYLIQSPKDAKFKLLSLDFFEVISDWYHYAIFELITLKGFQANHSWISKRLGIPPTQVALAIDRLKRLEIIKELGDGRWAQGSYNVTTISNKFTARAFRKHQRQILEMSLGALEIVPFEERDHSGMTMAISKKDLKKAKEMIKSFRRRFCERLQKNMSSRDEVYQLGISFYPLTKTETEIK